MLDMGHYEDIYVVRSEEPNTTTSPVTVLLIYIRHGTQLEHRRIFTRY